MISFKKAFWICVVLSLLIHFFVLFIVSQRLDRFAGEPLQKDKLEVMELDMKDLANYQIAGIEKPEHEKRPEKAKFAGLYDSTVAEEQVVANPYRGSRRPLRGQSPPEPPPQRPVGPENTSQIKESEHSHRRIDSAPKPTRGSGREPGPRQSRGQNDGLSPTEETGLPGDFFPDYKVGDKTYLNVLRFPKVGYFVRLKKIFYTTWNPRSAVMNSVGANQLSKGQVTVKLGVVVDRSGNLANVFMVNSSGLELYDREAMRTIRESSPFSVPPADLLDQTAQLRMLWTFTVYL